MLMLVTPDDISRTLWLDAPTPRRQRSRVRQVRKGRPRAEVMRGRVPATNQSKKKTFGRLAVLLCCTASEATRLTCPGTCNHIAFAPWRSPHLETLCTMLLAIDFLLAQLFKILLCALFCDTYVRLACITIMPTGTLMYHKQWKKIA